MKQFRQNILGALFIPLIAFFLIACASSPPPGSVSQPVSAAISTQPAAPKAEPLPVVEPTPVEIAAESEPVASTTFVEWLPSGPVVEGAESTLIRMEHGLYATFKTSGLEPGNALTLWWVAFNKPGNCSDGECDLNDVFLVDNNDQLILDDEGAPQPNVAGRAATEVSQLTGPGTIVDQDGSAKFLARLPVGDINEMQFGPGLLDPMGAEVHLIIRTHGPATPGVLPEQLTTPWGGCPEGWPKDPCRNIQIAIHSPSKVQGIPVGQPLAAADSGAAAREWMQLFYDRVQADKLSPPAAARIFAYAGVTLYEAIVPGLPNYKSLQGQLNELPTLPQPEAGSYSRPAVAASAVATVGKALFEAPESQAAIDQLRDQQLAALQEAGLALDTLERSTMQGQRLGLALVAWLETDGYAEIHTKSYTPPTGPGYWVPTSENQAQPLEPYWGELRSFALTTADACKAADPMPYSEAPSSVFYAQAHEVYYFSQTLTDEQKAIALFWADSPGQTGTPPGRWISIVNLISEQQQLSLDKTVELHALVGIGLADAFISCWKEKYTVSLLRPVSYIQQHIDPDWQSLIPTPPFPEYTSGHSAASAAAAEILTAILGPLPFTDTTHESRGLGARSFASFTEAANEAAISRLYGGIHYRMGVEQGLTQGQCIGQTVLDRVQTHLR